VEIVIGFVAGLVLGLFVGVAGRRSARAKGFDEGRSQCEAEVAALTRALTEGSLPEADSARGQVGELVGALRKGWTPRGRERREALQEAVGRVSRFLDRKVRRVLAEAGPDADTAELEERIGHVLGTVQDVEFFLSEPTTTPGPADIVRIAQQVSREFAQDHDATVRIQLGSSSIRASVSPEPLLDALYLLLHNAARFGGGGVIDMSVVTEEGVPRIRIRDRGPGFTEEAFRRAFDPFYSETDEGLGLGLPQARSLIEAMGGRIVLRNVPDGGGEVEVSLRA